MITKPIMLDETGVKLVAAIDRQNIILSKWAGHAGAMVLSMEEIQAIVRSGMAAEVFDIGDRIIVPWTVGTTTYQMVFNIVKFQNVELRSGEIVPGMYLASNYAILNGVPFDAPEAFYVNEGTTPLVAGTYNVTLTATWSNATAGTYQFTLPVDLPVGGRLTGFYVAADSGMTSGKVNMYTSDGYTKVAGGTDIAVTAGNGGTSLGTIAPTTGGTLNPLHYVGYGNNRWDVSALRQYLNSGAAAGSWWTSQHKYDVAPSEATSLAGFMAGFQDDFLSALKPVKVLTAKNTAIEDGSLVATYDTFFPPSLEEVYTTKQADGEGSFLPYWKRALGLPSPTAWYVTYPEYKHFAIENHASAQSVRLRSASRGNGNNTWLVHASGSIGYYYSYIAYRCAPLCVVA